MRKILSVFLKILVAVVAFFIAFLPVIHWVATLISPKVAEMKLLPLTRYNWDAQPLRWYDQLPQVLGHECFSLAFLVVLVVIGFLTALVVQEIWKKL